MKDSVTGKKPTKKNKLADGVPKSALPFFSVDTVEDAKTLQVLVCKRTYDGRYIVPGLLQENEETALDAAYAVSEMLADQYRAMKERK